MKNQKPFCHSLHYDLGPFSGAVAFVIGDFEEAVADTIRKEMNMPDLDWSSVDRASGVCWGSGTGHGVALIWIDNKGTKAQKLEVLVHEISHAVDHLMDHYGYEDTEVRARITGWLFGRVLEDTNMLSMTGFKSQKRNIVKK